MAQRGCKIPFSWPCTVQYAKSLESFFHSPPHSIHKQNPLANPLKKQPHTSFFTLSSQNRAASEYHDSKKKVLYTTNWSVEKWKKPELIWNDYDENNHSDSFWTFRCLLSTLQTQNWYWTFYLQVWYSEMALEAKNVFMCGFSAHFCFHF